MINQEINKIHKKLYIRLGCFCGRAFDWRRSRYSCYSYKGLGQCTCTNIFIKNYFICSYY